MQLKIAKLKFFSRTYTFLHKGKIVPITSLLNLLSVAPLNMLFLLLLVSKLT